MNEKVAQTGGSSIVLFRSSWMALCAGCLSEIPIQAPPPVRPALPSPDSAAPTNGIINPSVTRSKAYNIVLPESEKEKKTRERRARQ